MKTIVIPENETGTISLTEDCTILVGRDSAITLLGTNSNKAIIKLVGMRAKANIHTVFLGINDEKIALNIEIIHEAPHTESAITARGVLMDGSSADFTGTVQIQHGMHGCTTSQREIVLLLGDNARMTALPALEISNDDVQASHSVAISNIHDEQLFYLTARGMSETAAKQMIVQGFLENGDEKTRELFMQKLSRRENSTEENLVVQHG